MLSWHNNDKDRQTFLSAHSFIVEKETKHTPVDAVFQTLKLHLHTKFENRRAIFSNFKLCPTRLMKSTFKRVFIVS